MTTGLQATMAEHDAWFRARKAEYGALHGLPPVGAWDGNGLYRRIAEWNRGFLLWLRPKAEEWWSGHGYRIAWGERGSTLHAIETNAGGTP